ncbi:MAG: FG-GAP-like repeat-containing protein [Candidatus Latescibacterota bacterium]|nr:FG-GAP-like repeat-containing protein [Candidatus Latescibacterota bacterium]
MNISFNRLVKFLVALFAFIEIFCTSPEDKNESLQSLHDQAMSFVNNSKLDSASIIFRILITHDPNNYVALLGLAEINLRKKDLSNAVKYLKKAAKADTNRVEAAFQLSQIYRITGKEKKAKVILEQLVKRFPTYSPACMAYADVLMTDAPPNPEGALHQYESILSLTPNSQKAQAGAAASRLRLGDFSRAASGFKTLIESTPEDPHLTFLYATTLHWLQDFETAIKAYQRAVDVLPSGSPLRSVRLWNLRLAYIALHGKYPGDLPKNHILQIKPANGVASVKFVDIAHRMGVDKIDRGRGAAWGDLDGNGSLDLFTVGIHTPHGLYLRESQYFVEAKERSSLDHIVGGWAAAIADYDNDGDLDVYVTRDAWEGRQKNSLYSNNGYANFTDFADKLGVLDEDDSFTAAWGDVNSDGWLDLYVANGVTGNAAPNKLFLSQDGNHFNQRAGDWLVDDRGTSLGVALGDYDQDGDLDLYVSNVSGPNRLYRNEGQSFTDITSVAGVENPLNGSYIPLFFDSDSDGDLDLFVSAMSYYEDVVESIRSSGDTFRNPAHLYRNDGNDVFVERAVDAGIARSFGAMGAGAGDLDNDGVADLYLANGGPLMARFEPNALFLRRENSYAEVGQQAGVANLGKGHGVAFADIDEDGALDIYLGSGGHYPGDVWANSLYLNQGSSFNGISIKLNGSNKNKFGVGSSVVLHSGTNHRLQRLDAGSGFGSTNSYSLHYGLGSHNQIDSVYISWPDGQSEMHYPKNEKHNLIFDHSSHE